MREWLRGSDESDSGCRCEPSLEGNSLNVDSAACPFSGRLDESADCRATVVCALAGRSPTVVVTRSDGRERAYLDEDAELLVAAARFASQVTAADARLAERARREPLAAAREATGRVGPVADIADRSGFADAVDSRAETGLEPYVGPAVSDTRILTEPPEQATLRDRRTLDTDAVVRRYDTPPSTLDSYHVRPREHEFDAEASAALDAAVERLATAATDRRTTPESAVKAAARADVRVPAVAAVLRKHTRGLGILEDIFADPRVSDVFATAPVTETRLRVRADGETLRTNVRLSDAGARGLASTFRRTSGRAFSRASPTLDATATVADRQVRVAGVTEPVSDGVAFAFRAHGGDSFRLPDLVANGTVPAPVAGLLSVAVKRGAACLVAGPRGAGKTTTLGALLWELPKPVRTVVIEDTPELPVSALQDAGRDVQPLRTRREQGPSVDAATALRTALRLGDGALVVGEVRGEEAGVLYEAMRVGSGDNAVLGTIHGSGGDSVRERLVSDLGVPESALSATDCVVTLAPPTDNAGRGVAAVEEVIDHGDGVGFEPLYERDGPTATTAGHIERGTSRLVESLTGAGESYADVQECIAKRSDGLRGSVRKP